MISGGGGRVAQPSPQEGAALNGGRGDEQHPAPHHHLEKWLEDEQDLD